MLQKLSSWTHALIFLLLPVQTSIHFWPSWSYVNQIRVDYLSPTLFLVDIPIIAYISLNLYIHRPAIKKYHLAIFLLLLLVFFNISFSLSPAVSLYKFARLLVYILLFYSLVSSSKLISRLTLVPLCVSTFFISLLSWLQFFSGSSQGGFWYWLGERTFNISTPTIAKITLGNFGLFLRPYSTFPHPNVFAVYLLLAFIIISFLKTRLSLSSALSRAVFLLQILILFTLQLTFSKSIILLALPLLIILPKFSPVFKTFLVIGVLLALYFPFRYFSPTSFTERLILNQHAISQIIARPLLGTGLGTYPLLSPVLFQPVHNTPFLLAAEIGVPFASVLLVLLYKSLRTILSTTPLVLKYGFLVVGLTSFVDHYWLSIPQATLVLTVFLSLVTVEFLSSHYGRPKNKL